MKLSTKTEYGIRAILEIAKCGSQPLNLKTIAQRHNISTKYLEQLMAILKSAGFIRSIRGPKGGYILAKSPKNIIIADVFKTLEGPVIAIECLSNKDYCPQVNECVIKELWQKVQVSVNNVLKSVTLQDLIDKARDKKQLTYQI